MSAYPAKADELDKADIPWASLAVSATSAPTSTNSDQYLPPIAVPKAFMVLAEGLLR